MISLVMDKIIEFADGINRIDQSTYFVKLNKKPSLKNFIESQKGFITAVDHWSKLLAQLIVILPTSKDRMAVVNNLYDEHGNGDETKTHVTTFSNFIESLQESNTKQAIYPTCTYTTTEFAQAFNQRLQDQFKTSDWIFCTSMLAMIEYTYIKVCKMIHTYASQFIKEDKIEHYSLHETIDQKHATDLFKIIEASYSNHNKTVHSAMIFGYNTMYKLYEDMATVL